MRFEMGVGRSPARILFGAGQRRALGAVAAGIGKRALVCTDARFAGLPEMAAILADFEAHGVEVRVFSETQAELPLECIHACVEAHRDFAPDMLVGLGGGSCLDLAKLVSLLLSHEGPISSWYGEFRVPGPVLPVIAVPTTSGTGSEVTPVAVVGDPERAIKVGVSSPELIPHTAICDPELTLTCPKSLTAISGADALAHAIEAFAATERPFEPGLALERVFIGKNALSDHHAMTAIKLLFRWLPVVVEDGANLEARSAVMLASTLAGLAFGVAGTAAAHAIQYPVGGLTHTAHGLGVGILLPYTMEFNAPVMGEVYGQIADIVYAPQAGNDRAADAVEAVRGLFAAIGIPETLTALGLSEEHIPAIAEQTMLAARLVDNNPRKLDQAAVASIARRALAGSAVQETEKKIATR